MLSEMNRMLPSYTETAFHTNILNQSEIWWYELKSSDTKKSHTFLKILNESLIIGNGDTTKRGEKTTYPKLT